MRIMSVSNFYDTHGGGLERVAAQLARQFALAGHHSSWAASDADGLPETPAEVIGLRCANPTETLTGLPMPLPGPASINRLSKAIRDCDMLVIHDALYATSILALLFAKARRKPVVLIQHIGTIPFASRGMRTVMRVANALITRPMMAAADRVVFISQTVRDELLGPQPKRNSQLLFNGVEQRVFHRSNDTERANLRISLALPTEEPLAVFVGRFVEKKGLAVIQQLAAALPIVHFALVGQGPINPETWNLANVHVLGQLPQSTVADLYRAGDFLILPSVGEGFPLVIQEAMACGLPVVCGAPADRADPEATKWLRGVAIDLADPKGSAVRCAQAIDSLALSADDRDAMARYAASRYDWRKMAEGVIALVNTPIATL
jgi:starch synthase